MKIAFLGDIHGRIFHGLTVVVKWQIINKEKLDCIIQLGDMGAYPNPTKEILNNKFVKNDPTELDFSKFIKGGADVNKFVEAIKSQLKVPMHFIRGNHEDFDWLDALKDEDGIAEVDKSGLLKFIKDGTVVKLCGLNFAFLGGAEFGAKNGGELNQYAYDKLIKTDNNIDILATHEVYYGIGFSYHGLTQGSKRITELVNTLNPKYHITAHYHHMIGPHKRHNTTHLGLNNLVLPLRGKPGRNLRQGWMAVMDTKDDSIEFVKDRWVTDINTHMDIKNLTDLLK